MIECSKSHLFWLQRICSVTMPSNLTINWDSFERDYIEIPQKLDLLLRMCVWLQFVRMHSYSRGHWYYKIDICPELQVIVLHKASPVIYWFCLMQFTQNEILTLSVSTIKCSSEFHWFNSDNFRTSEKLFMCWAWENISNIFY